MAIITVLFDAEPGYVYKALPRSGNLSDYVPSGIASVPVAGKPGQFQISLDDQHNEWYLFRGNTQPEHWNKNIMKWDFSQNTTSDQTLASMVETVDGQIRFKQSALAQVVRWISGQVLPNEPFPPARRLGVRDLTLFNGEDLQAIIPLESLDDETLSSIEGEELRFTVETSRKVVLLSSLLTVENGSLQVPSTAALTERKQNLQWSLRWPDTGIYITGGRITVAYAPINPQ
jgi:hypothetical protein